MRKTLLAAIGLTLACGVQMAQADTYRWITYKPQGAGDAQQRTTQWFADEFAKRTGGKHKIEIFWGGSVAKAGEIPDALSGGVGDFGDIVTPYFPDRFPLNNAVGFFIPQPNGVLKIAELLTMWNQKYPQFTEEMTRNKIKVIGYRPLEEYNLICVKPVKTLADFKGLRIRSYGFAYPKIIQALGASPVSMKTEDTYEALERKILDCSPIGVSLAHGWKYDEVAKYYVKFPFGASFGHLLAMNLAAYNKMDSATRTVVDQMGAEYVKVYNSAIEADINKVLDIWKTSGVSVVDVDVGDMAKLIADPGIQAVRKNWADRARAVGVDPAPIVKALEY